jgi:hypothetical protein
MSDGKLRMIVILVCAALVACCVTAWVWAW